MKNRRNNMIVDFDNPEYTYEEKFSHVPDLPGEEWKEPEGFWRYRVSNKGRIKRISHQYTAKNGQAIFYPEMLMAQSNNQLYKIVTLIDNNHKRKELRVSRLVAKAFIPNPNNYNICNHKNEVKHNNCVENLEWTDDKGNCNWGTRNTRISKKNQNRKFSAEHKRKLSEAAKGNKRRLGKKNNDKQRRALAKTVEQNSKPVICEGVVYPNISACAAHYGLRMETMSRWLRGERTMPKEYRDMGLSYYSRKEQEND